jgi:O-antigen/teichoic acid export membrane protein
MATDNREDDRFDTAHLSTDLKTRSLRGGAATLTSQGLLFLIRIGSTMILARLLTPRDYGLISMVAAITGFAGIFSDLGLSTATIQRSHVTHRQVSNLFWINAGLGAGITIVVAALSPVVAWFYKSPQLLWVTVALSMNFVIAGLAIQHRALLNRQMQFLTLAKVQILSALIGIAVAIFAATRGFGYWALVLNTLSASASSVVGVWLVSGWRPCLPHHGSAIRSMLRFGSDIAAFNVINYFSRNLDNILIGRYYGSEPLGLYTKAYQLLMLPMMNLREPLNRVAMPSLSRLQHEPERYRRYYLTMISFLAFATMPLVMLMYVCSDILIQTVLGDQWMGASRIFKVLAVAALIQPVWGTLGVVLLSTGRSRECFVWGVGIAVMSVTSFVVGLPWGARGVAIAYTVATYLMFWPSVAYALKGLGMGIKEFLLATYRPGVASVAMGIACAFVQSKVNYGNIVTLTMCASVSIAVYLGTICAFPNGRKDLKEYLSYVRLVVPEKSRR